jgi:hypothetical protein
MFALRMIGQFGVWLPSSKASTFSGDDKVY